MAILARIRRALRRSPLDPLFIAKQGIEREISIAAANFGHGELLDIGCGEKPYKKYFDGRVSRYVGLDTPDSKSTVVDVRGDALATPFEKGSFDTILMSEVLEHLPEPGLALREAHRVLRPGGHIILSTPMVWGLHEEPYDFYRYTKYGLEYLAKSSGFEPLYIHKTTGTFGTCATRVSSFLYYLDDSGKSPLAYLMLPVCFCINISGLLLDAIFSKRGDTIDNVMVARKNK